MDEEIRTLIPLESSTLSESRAMEALAIRPPEQVAADIAKVLDVIAVRLGLETPHPSTAARVRGARTVPREFVLSMAAAAERLPHLPVVGKFDGARAREVLESADALRLVAQRTAMLLANLNYTIEAQWAEVATAAMRTLSVASIVAESPKEAELAAEVENLRRQLGRKGRSKKKKAEKAGGNPG